MSAFRRNDQLIPVFVFSQPVTEKSLASVLTIGEPGGVDLGGVQHIAARAKVRFEDFFRGRIIDCGTERSGAKAEHRRGEVRVWNKACFHWRFSRFRRLRYHR